MAQANPNTRIIVGASGFTEGVDSFSHPLFVKPTQLRWMENGVMSGGLPQVRPGYKTRLNFLDLEFPDEIRHPQMLVSFQPTNGPEQLVFAISGHVYYAPINADGSLQQYKRIEGLTFSQHSDQIVGVSVVQSGTILAGKYANNIVPRNLLIIQDGVNRAGIWDGISGIHANPTKKITIDQSGNTLYDEAYNQTRIGLWMAWSGNRLWVANGKQLFASDLGDPVHFTEEMTLNSLQVITFPDVITGLVDRGTSGTSKSQLIAFTQDSTWTIWSGIQNRIPNSYGIGWAYTQDFITKIFSAVGCVAGKSVIVHRGILYWRGQDGIVMFDSSGTVYATQNLPAIDQELANSKRLVSPDASTTCAGFRDSFVFWSVPVGPVKNGRPYNGHTQVLDRQITVVRSVGDSGPYAYGSTGWQGVWTGMRPVEWANSNAYGQLRTYALSMDQDGVVRIWEAFQGNRADNGHAIPWLVETKAHAVAETIFEYSKFRHFRVVLDQLCGNFTITGSWKGLRGNYKSLMENYQINATPGGVFTQLQTPIRDGLTIQNYSLQGRTLVSPDSRGDDATCTTSGVESQYVDGIDHAFSLLFNMTGRGAIVAYRIACDKHADYVEGTAIENSGISESGLNIVPETGCPQHIAGNTPTYTLPDAPNSLSFVPVVPSFDESTLYAAPVYFATVP